MVLRARYRMICLIIWYTYLALSRIIISYSRNTPLRRHYIYTISLLYIYIYMCVVLFWRPPALFKSAGAASLIRLRSEGVLTYRVNVVLLTVFVYKDYMVVIRLHVYVYGSRPKDFAARDGQIRFERYSHTHTHTQYMTCYHNAYILSLHTHTHTHSTCTRVHHHVTPFTRDTQ